MTPDDRLDGAQAVARLTAFLTVRAVADRWQCSTRTVQRRIDDGSLPAARFGPKLIRIPTDALEAFEATLCSSPDQPSTASDPTPGTLSGPRGDARVVSLQRRQTR